MRSWPIAVAVLLLAPILATGQEPSASESGSPQILLAPARAADNVLTVQEAAGLPPTIQDGIGPGTAMRMGVDGIQYICSTSFLVRDPTTMTYYVSTAGHCLVRDNSDPTPRQGMLDPGAVMNRIDLCIEGCMNNGLGMGTYVSLTPTAFYHPVRFATSGGVGSDFGLVEIPKELHQHLRPELSQWGGPTQVATSGGLGALVAHYGHGTIVVPGVAGVVTRTPVDQGRLAALSFHNGASWEALGHVTGGDSGSAASLAVADASGVVQGTEALGVITHSIIYVGAPLMSGTTMAYGMDIAQVTTGLQLELVPEGDPLPSEPPAPAAPDVVVSIESPSETTVPAGVIDIRGTASATDPLPSGTEIQVAVDDPGFAPANRLEVTGNSSWATTWDAEPGDHVVRVRALDADGVVLDQANRSVTVREPAQEPQHGAEPEPQEPDPSPEPAGGDAEDGEAGDGTGPATDGHDGVSGSVPSTRSDDAATPPASLGLAVMALLWIAVRRR